MIRILFIDSISLVGHVNFNLIYLKELSKYNVKIDVVFKNNYIDLQSISNIERKIYLPNFLYLNITGYGIISRFFVFMQLLYIRMNVKMSNYDLIIMSSYDEISLFFSGIKTKMYLINHDNARGFESKVKTYFLKQISKYHSHIVFNDYVKDFFTKKQINDVYVVQHGLQTPIQLDVHADKIAVNVNKRISKDVYDEIWFIPSFGSDLERLNAVLNDVLLQNYLIDNNILIVVKSKKTLAESENILVITDYLKKCEYEAIFSISDAIIIVYPDSFKCRVSAVLFESISNNKQCFISDLPALNIFNSYFNYDPFFNNATDLIKRIERSKIKDKAFYKNVEMLNPDFQDIFDRVFVCDSCIEEK